MRSGSGSASGRAPTLAGTLGADLIPVRVRVAGFESGWPVDGNDGEMGTRGTVRSWDRQSRSGVIDSPQTPGGCWLPSTAIERKDAFELSVGDLIDFEWKQSAAEAPKDMRYQATQAWPQPPVPRKPRWRLNLNADDATNAPTHFVEACRAVGRDTQCFAEFDKYSSLMWTIEDTTDEIPAWTIGLNVVQARADGADIPSGFGFGLPYETDIANATAKIAEAVQDWLSGYEFVLWPIASRSPLLLLKPDVRDGNAVWIDRTNDSVTCLIGELCPTRASAPGNTVVGSVPEPDNAP